jgi:hypothetical protein
MAGLLPMPGENLAPKVSRLTGDISSLEARFRRLETLLEQFRPQFVQIQDINGKLRRYSALARFDGTATDLNYGMPFEIKDVSSKNIPRVTVYRHSSLRRSLRANDRIIIKGLDDGKGQGAFRVGLYDLIWLEITVEDGVAKSAKIEHGRSGWEDYPEPVKFKQVDDGDEFVQTKAFICIAQIVEDDKSDVFDPPGTPLPKGLMVSQYLNSHLVMLDTCYNNVQCIYPFPHVAPVLE